MGDSRCAFQIPFRVPIQLLHSVTEGDPADSGTQSLTPEGDVWPLQASRLMSHPDHPPYSARPRPSNHLTPFLLRTLSAGHDVMPVHLFAVHLPREKSVVRRGRRGAPSRTRGRKPRAGLVLSPQARVEPVDERGPAAGRRQTWLRERKTGPEENGRNLATDVNCNCKNRFGSYTRNKKCGK